MALAFGSAESFIRDSYNEFRGEIASTIY